VKLRLPFTHRWWLLAIGLVLLAGTALLVLQSSYFPAPDDGQETPDLQAPPASLWFESPPRLALTDDGLEVRWETSVPTDALVMWGRTDPLEKVLAKNVSAASQHRIALPAVPLPWLHVFQVVSRSREGTLLKARVQPGNHQPTFQLLKPPGIRPGRRAVCARAEQEAGAPLLVLNPPRPSRPTLLQLRKGRVENITDRLQSPLPEAGILEAVWEDYNNDGHLDLTAVTPDKVLLYRNDGPPEYELHRAKSLENTLAAPLKTSLMMDIDGDGFSDIATVSEEGEVGFLRNYGPPSYNFRAMEPVITAEDTEIANHVRRGSILKGHFVGNGMIDLVLTSGNGMLLENLGGAFQPIEDSFPAEWQDPRCAARADFNLDGNQDICAALPESGKVLLLSNSGDREFTKAQELPKPGNKAAQGATCVAWANLTDNSAPDLVIGCTGGQIRFLFNSGGKMIDASSICRPPQLEELGAVSHISSGDLDGDGMDDLFVTGVNQKMVLLQNRIREQFSNFMAGDR